MTLSSRIQLMVIASILTISCQPKSGGDSGGGAPAAVDPQCSSQPVSTCANNTNCAVSGTSCAGTAAFCNTFSADTACLASSCQWSSTTLKCTPRVATTTTTPTTTTTTTTPATAAQCNTATSQASCASTSGCTWNGSQCISTTSTTTTSSCSSYSQTQCSTISGCAWNGVQCVTTSNPGTIPGTTPNNNLPLPGSTTPTTPSSVCSSMGMLACIVSSNCTFILLPLPHCQ